jgi:hypothetical protein
MTQINAQADTGKNENTWQPAQDDPHREFLMGALCSARLRVRLLQNEIDTVGIAIKSGLITPEVAFEWLRDIDALQFVPEIGREGEPR